MRPRRDPTAPFVVGVARSGTTLLRLMLDAHPDLAIPPETHFAGRVIEAFEPGRGGRTAATDAILTSPRWRDFGLSATDFGAAAATADGPGALLRSFYTAYAARHGKPRWGDKTPPYLDRMDQIQEALPEAGFIHIIRDGRDAALSIVPLWFGPDDIPEAARQWSRRIAAARRQARDLPRYMEVRYEDLVGDPATALRGVCDFLGLPWDPTMLDYHRAAGSRHSETVSDVLQPDGERVAAAARQGIHDLTGQPPREDRVGRWRTEMSRADRLAFQNIAGEMLDELGYPPE